MTLEAVTYAPEIAEKMRERIAGEQDAARQQAAITWEGERQRLQLQKEAETARFKAEQQLAALETQKKVTQAETEMASMRAEADAKKKILLAKADAEAAIFAAKARAEEKRSETAGITPMEVMMHAYDALGQLGGIWNDRAARRLGPRAELPLPSRPRVPRRVRPLRSAHADNAHTRESLRSSGPLTPHPFAVQF